MCLSDWVGCWGLGAVWTWWRIRWVDELKEPEYTKDDTENNVEVEELFEDDESLRLNLKMYLKS